MTKRKSPSRERVDSLGWKWSDVKSPEGYLEYIDYAAFVFGDHEVFREARARILKEIEKKRKKTAPTK
jgi:tRNA pseudouridine-54 N-methylase